MAANAVASGAAAEVASRAGTDAGIAMFGLVTASAYRRLQKKYDDEIVERRLLEIEKHHLLSELEWCRKAIDFMRQLTKKDSGPHLVE